MFLRFSLFFLHRCSFIFFNVSMFSVGSPCFFSIGFPSSSSLFPCSCPLVFFVFLLVRLHFHELVMLFVDFP